MLLLALAGCAHHAGGAPTGADPTGGSPPVAPAAPSVPGPLLGGPLAEVPVVPPEEAEAKALYVSARARVDALDFAGAKAQLAELVARYPTTEVATPAARLAAQIAIVGQQAPPLEVARWLQGEADIPAQGSVVLVFFEAWCPHCVDEAPHLQQIANAWAGRDLQVVALTRLSRGSTEEQVMALGAANAWTFPVGVERDGAVTTAYGGSGVPSAAVVVDGTVVWRGHPARLTDAVLTSLVR